MLEEATVNERYIAEHLSGGLRIGVRKWIIVFVGTAIYMLVYPMVFRGGGRGSIAGMLLFFAGWSLPTIVAFALFGKATGGGGFYNAGKRLLRSGNHAKAARMFVKAVQWRHVEAAKLLGDMHMPGGGLETDADKAVGWYAKSLSLLESEVDVRAPGGGGLDPASALAKPDASVPSDPGQWLSRLADVLRSLSDKGNAPAKALLAEALWLSGRYADALALARTLPGDDAMGMRAECFVRMLDKDLPQYRLGDPVDDENAKEGFPGVERIGFWGKKDHRRLAYASVGVAYMFGICLAGGHWGISASFIPALAVFIPVLFLLVVWRRERRDPYAVGERLLRKGRPAQAARAFTLAYQDGRRPDAAKRLGEMRLEGIGMERDWAKAMTAYVDAAMFLIQERARDKDSERDGLFAGGPRHCEITGDPEAFAAWVREVREALERLGASGKARAYVLLDELEPDRDRYPRYARLAFETDPSAENEVFLATRILNSRGATGEEARESEAALERLFGRGDYQAGFELVRVFLYGAVHVAKDPSRALALYRRLLRETPVAGKHPWAEYYVRMRLGVDLMAAAGFDALTDEDCLIAGNVLPYGPKA